MWLAFTCLWTLTKPHSIPSSSCVHKAFTCFCGFSVLYFSNDTSIHFPIVGYLDSKLEALNNTIIKCFHIGPGVTAQEIRALDAFAEVLSLGPSIHMVWLTIIRSYSFEGSEPRLWTL